MAEQKPGEQPEDEQSADTAPMPISRPANPGRTRVIRPAGGRRPLPSGAVPPVLGESSGEQEQQQRTGGAGTSAGSPGVGGRDTEPGSASDDDTLPIPPQEPARPEAEATRATGAAATGPESAATATTGTGETTASTPSVAPEDPAPAAGDGAQPARVPRPRFRVTRFQILAAVLLGALGFGLVVQARQTTSNDLSSLSQSELVRVLDDVSRQSERLDAEARTLEETQNELQSGTDRAAAAEKATRERLDVLGILAGTEPAQGPGVVIRIEDPQALLDASTVLDAVQELRDAGAEAIQFGQVRVVASTSFTDPPTGGAVVADGLEQSPPYRLLAIGDPATMESALNIPGGVLETLHQVGASGTVQRRQDLEVPVVREAVGPTYAVPRTDEPQD
ncbi:DUF881 domain-containing protein [Kineosporia babensis]|uniref:DUF881 domain-containing protein n=1 Tax=Kineosporia babensis TaxID=499548 RepID=A0A9X1STV9_9ACTN|nr:DUF881 domain-containing protein [Kineosporia babensis]MCD5312324.1 DUF881 domain-containing protein [Kineosporia babensis]